MKTYRNADNFIIEESYVNRGVTSYKVVAKCKNKLQAQLGASKLNRHELYHQAYKPTDVETVYVVNVDGKVDEIYKNYNAAMNRKSVLEDLEPEDVFVNVSSHKVIQTEPATSKSDVIKKAAAEAGVEVVEHPTVTD